MCYDFFALCYKWKLWYHPIFYLFFCGIISREVTQFHVYFNFNKNNCFNRGILWKTFKTKFFGIFFLNWISQKKKSRFKFLGQNLDFQVIPDSKIKNPVAFQNWIPLFSRIFFVIIKTVLNYPRKIKTKDFMRFNAGRNVTSLIR